MQMSRGLAVLLVCLAVNAFAEETREASRAPMAGPCRPWADQQWNCTTPACTSHVQTGQAQPNYQCAEYAARVVASGGHIPGLNPMSAQSFVGAFKYGGKTYDLLWVSSKHFEGENIIGLEDYLIAAGWKNAGTSTANIHDCSVVITDGSKGPYSHAVVGVANNLLNAHNVARKGVAGSTYHINVIYNPPNTTYVERR